MKAGKNILRSSGSTNDGRKVGSPLPTTTQLTGAPATGFGRVRQSQIYQFGLFGRLPHVPTHWTALEALAARRLSAKGYAYIAGGAGMEVTQRDNMAAFDRWALVPRMLRDVSVRDTAVTLFGRRLPAPLLLAPVGALGLVHPQADRAVAAAAAEYGVPYIFSNQALEDNGRVCSGDGGFPAMVPAVLEHQRRSGAQFGGSGGEGRL